jgi:hypothetical protein
MMRIDAGSLVGGLLSKEYLKAAPFLGAMLLSVMVVACSGDDEDAPDATQVSGSLASVTPTVTAADPTAEATALSGTLVPLPSATPAPTSTSGGGPREGEPQTVAMIDMAPCDDSTHFEEQTMGEGVPILAYRDVPVGTPILFPFERGRLLEADSRQGGILLFYEVPDVGIFSIYAAGSSTLDRHANSVRRGSVIGHFAGTFEAGDTEAFEGYQLFAAAGTTELRQIGDEIFVGEALDPNVTDCLVLPSQ